MKLQHFAIGYLRAQIRLLAAISKKMAGNLAFKIFCTPYNKVKYTPSSFTAKAEALHLIFNNKKTFGYRWNKGGVKKILIAHGFRSGAVNFVHFVQKLIDKNYEVIAFDAPAHGISQGNTINALQYKEFIELVNEQYGPFDGYLTHSFGGLAVSLAIAEMKQNDNINIVLIAPAANTQQLTQYFFKEMQIKDEQVQYYFLENIKRLSGKNIEWFSIARCLKTMHSNILWVQDSDDKVTPADDALAVKEIQLLHVSFHFTQGLGHRRIYKDEQVVNAIVRFL